MNNASLHCSSSTFRTGVEREKEGGALLANPTATVEPSSSIPHGRAPTIKTRRDVGLSGSSGFERFD